MGGREAPTLPKMTSDWASARNTSTGWPQFLEAVYIDGVRGWDKQWVEFRFPVVAIAGENGSGKSTVLKAAAAAYGPELPAKDYSPDDFFPTTPWEVVEGVRLEYRVRRGQAVTSHSVRKATSRWRGMPERPKRHTYFLDISRTQPIDSLIGYGRVARVELAKSAEKVDLTIAFRGMLSRILGRTYDSGSLVRDDRGKQVGIVTSGGTTYSNFHQGAGEDTTTDLMALLQEAPRNSLILIDEVESSLHPRAQRRLMTELISVATQRRLQLIVSTHSPYVLEQLPAEARIYLRSGAGAGKEPIYGVTADYALSLMDDESHPELLLYCEDYEAQTIIDTILRLESPNLAARVSVVPVGPAGTVKMLGDLVNSGKLPESAMGVLDSDQVEAPGCILLPGKQFPPEVNVFADMKDENYLALGERLGVNAGELMDAVEDARRLEDHHTWAARTAKKLGGVMRATRVWDAFADVWVRDVLTSDERLAFTEAVQAGLPVMLDSGDQ